MIFLRSRYYDPHTGTFISRDTYPGTLTNPASQHRYTYTENNPINYTDPSGHSGRIPPFQWWPSFMIPIPQGLDTLIGFGCQLIDPYLPFSFDPPGLDGQSWIYSDTPAQYYQKGINASFTFFAIFSGIRMPINVPAQSFIIKPNRPNYPGTGLHQSFIISSSEYKFYVPPSGTKHMAREIVKMEMGPAAETSLGAQLMLEDFNSAVGQAVAQGIIYNEKMYFGSWELIFNPSRNPDWIDVIFHAVFRP